MTKEVFLRRQSDLDMFSDNPIKVDQAWYVQLPGDPKLYYASVTHVSNKTIQVLIGGYNSRYLKADIKFVEKV